MELFSTTDIGFRFDAPLEFVVIIFSNAIWFNHKKDEDSKAEI